MRMENELVKLITNDEREVYVSIIKLLNENCYQVRILKQPIYELATMRDATALFKQFVHEDDVLDCVPMTYDSNTMTITVCESMIVTITRSETIDLLKYFNYTSFGELRENKTRRQIDFEKAVINEALETLYSA